MTTYTLQIIVEGKDHASGPLSGISSALGGMGTIAGGILGADLLRNIASGIFNVGAQAVGATANFQAMTIGMESLLARELRVNDATLDLSTALGRAAPMAQDLLKQIKDLSIRSPYEMGTVQDTFRLAMAFGFGSQEAMSFTRGILNMGAGIGASNEMLGRMAYNFAQIRMQGKVTAVDIRQLAMAGFDLNSALKDIGSQFGLTINDYNDFNEAIASGKIKWEDFATAFEKYADKNFGGAAARMSQSLNGLKSTFNDFFLMTMPALLGPAAEVVTGFLNNILSKLMAFADSGQLEVWGQALGAGLENAIKGLGFFAQAFSLAGLDAFAGFDPEALQRLFNIPPGAAQIISGIAAALRETFSLITGLMPIVSMALQNFGLFWTMNGPQIMTIAGAIFTSIVAFVTNLATTLLPWLMQQFLMFSTWFVTYGPVITSALSVLAERFNLLLQVVTIVFQAMLPIISGALNFIVGSIAFWAAVVTGNWQLAWTTLLSITQALGMAIWNGILTFLNGIAGLFGTSLNQIGQLWTENWNLFLSIMTAIGGLIISAVLTFASAVESAFRYLVTGIKNTINGAAGAVTKAFSNMMNGAYNAVMGIVDKILGAISKAMDAIAGLGGAGASAGGGGMSGPGSAGFTPHALGGPVTSGLPYLVGERGPELFWPGRNGTIIPNNELLGASRASAGGGTTYQTINIQISGAGDPEAVADRVMRRLRMNNGLAGV